MRAIVEEADRIWSANGVTLQEGHARDAVTVLIAEGTRRPGSRSWSSPLGEISFAATGEPRRVILLFYDAAARLITGAKASGTTSSQFAILHQPNVIGRVLGRALAHEIGHYLLRSPGHSAGLMRAHQ